MYVVQRETLKIINHQSEKLEKAGVILMPSNAQAVKLSSLILGRLNKI